MYGESDKLFRKSNYDCPLDTPQASDISIGIDSRISEYSVYTYVMSFTSFKMAILEICLFPPV